MLEFEEIIHDKINKGILKFLEKNEAMVVDEDPFPPVALVNINSTDMRAFLNESEDEKFSPNVKIRKVWIPKEYLFYKDELVVKGKVSIAREKEKMKGIYTIQNKKSKRINPSKKRIFLQKRDILFPRKRAVTL